MVFKTRCIIECEVLSMEFFGLDFINSNVSDTYGRIHSKIVIITDTGSDIYRHIRFESWV